MIERAEPVAEAPDGEVESESMTTTIPLSMLGGQEVNAGDVIRLKVVSSDGETIEVTYDHPEEESDEMNTEKMAASIGKEPPMKE